MQTITTIGLDIAKSVFQVDGIDAEGTVILRRQLKRRYVLVFFQKLPPCLVGIEACASSHYWSRELKALGHAVRPMPPAYVKPYVKRQKNDATDAEAICEAVTRPNMRYVAAKTEEQQSCLTLHRTRHLIHSPTDRPSQCDPRPSCRVWDCRTGRAPGCRGTTQCRRRCQ
jgi:transposase